MFDTQKQQFSDIALRASAILAHIEGGLLPKLSALLDAAGGTAADSHAISSDLKPQIASLVVQIEDELRAVHTLVAFAGISLPQLVSQVQEVLEKAKNVLDNGFIVVDVVTPDEKKYHITIQIEPLRPEDATKLASELPRTPLQPPKSPVPASVAPKAPVTPPKAPKTAPKGGN